MKAFVVAPALCLLACGAGAQTALVETAAMTAAREAVRVFVQEVRLDTGVASPLATPLPGAAPAAPLFVDADGAVVTATAGSDRGPASRIVGMSAARPLIENDAWRVIDGEWPLLAGTVRGNGAGGPRAVIVSAIAAGPMADRGRIDAWPFAPGPPSSVDGPRATWLLPGRPVAAVTNGAAGWAAVLCVAPNGGTVLHVRDVRRGGVIREQVPMAQPSARLEPAALALAPDGATLVAILNDIDAASAVDEGRCWAAVLDARGFAPIGAPVELPGTVDARGAVAFADNGIWVATRSPSAGFAFVYELARNDSGFAVHARQSYTGLSGALVLAAGGNAVAVGVDRRVEFWRDGKRDGDALAYRAPIAALEWGEGLLLVAEANRVHGVDADRRAVWTTPFQSGQVTALAVLPGPIAPERFADADGDRLADPIDPEPDTPSPRLDVPFEIALRSDAAGNEVRAVRIASTYDDSPNWLADVDAGAAPWLRVFPRVGRVPGWFLAGADPSRLEPGGAVSHIDVSMTGTRHDTQAAGSPRRVAVHVRARGAESARVLWLLGRHNAPLRHGRGNGGFGAVADLLAGPPCYLSHDETIGRAFESIGDYAAVVLDTAAIGAGLVSRQALLDYVARGGGLLVIAPAAAGHDAGDGVVQRWLAPAGIVFESGRAPAGAMDAVTPHPVTRHWQKSAMADAAQMTLDRALNVVVGNDGAPGLAVRPFGRGRIAVLASSAPLDSEAMAAPVGRLFALDLFEWLARAAIETKDLDADGLPDNIEDRDHNGVVDPGETSRLDPDSDGDGIPDGKEDANANGTVDNDETDPLNPDSDGDGDWDGADGGPRSVEGEHASG